VFARQVFDPLKHASSPSSPTLFCFSYFSDRVLIFAWGSLGPSYLWLPVQLGPQHHHVWLIDCNGVSQMFCPGWPRTTILSISWVAGIMGMSHHAQHENTFLKYFNARHPVAHACNSNYSGGRDQEDRGSKSALGK
jgi:hypothetical protein